MTNTLIRRWGFVALALGLVLPGWAAAGNQARGGVITLGPASFQVQDCAWERAYLDYDFVTADQTLVYEPLAAFRVAEGTPSVSLAAPVHLPEGAEVSGVIVNYYDSDPATEPSMGLYAIVGNGRMMLIADASGRPDFSEGVTTVNYKVKPVAVPAGTPYEFRVTLNRSPKDPTMENALFRAQITYRISSRLE